jgi:glucoselysine-6-phosphate deglycase
MTLVTMFDYIKEEKDVLSAILSNYDFSKNDLANAESVLILATGSSNNACLAAKNALESFGGVTVEIQEPYHFNHYGHLPKAVDTVIAVSQSGKSASTVDALAGLKETNIQTVALTSNLDSPIVQAAEQVIDLGMGIEKVGFVTKGYSATVLQLILLGLSIGWQKQQLSDEELASYKKQLEELIQKIPAIIQKTEAFFEENQALFKLAQRFAAIGYGPNWGTAKEFETKFTETVRVPSQGFELEAYMHGPYLEANSSHILFFTETASENLARSRKLVCLHGTACWKSMLTITTEKANERRSTLLRHPLS